MLDDRVELNSLNCSRFVKSIVKFGFPEDPQECAPLERCHLTVSF